jgi:hypothetical protein
MPPGNTGTAKNSGASGQMKRTKQSRPDENCLYAIGNHVIGKYDKKSESAIGINGHQLQAYTRLQAFRARSRHPRHFHSRVAPA